MIVANCSVCGAGYFRWMLEGNKDFICDLCGGKLELNEEEQDKC